MVSIHAPAGGGDVSKLFSMVLCMKFQSTLPRGERPATELNGVVELGFNPRSRGGSDATKEWEDKLDEVSIHAPAGGAT